MILRWLMRKHVYQYPSADSSLQHVIDEYALKMTLKPSIKHLIYGVTGMIKTVINSVPDFYKGETWEFYGQLEYSDGSTAPDISGNTVTVFLYDSSGALKFSEDADVVTNGATGRYDVAVQKANTNLCTGNTKYYCEIKWYYNAGVDNKMLYKGEVNCRTALKTEA